MPGQGGAGTLHVATQNDVCQAAVFGGEILEIVPVADQNLTIPPLGGEYGERAPSARAGNTLCFPNVPKISHVNSKLASFQSDRVKYSVYGLSSSC